MQASAEELHEVEVESLGERLSSLRLCESSALDAMRRSLEQHGQLSALTLFHDAGALEIIDGFKRVRAARALGLRTLVSRVESVSAVQAKLLLCALQQGRGLSELEEGWLVRSLYREDGLTVPEIAQQMRRHKSWVWRRLMLVEALELVVQADVRLGLIVPRAAMAISRLPRGNQQAAGAVVMQRGLTVRQAEQLVEQALSERDDAARAAWLSRRLCEPASFALPGPRPLRRARSGAERLSMDVLQLQEIAARMTARLYATPLETFTADAAQLLRDALLRVSPVLQALRDVIETVTRERIA